MSYRHLNIDLFKAVTAIVRQLKQSLHVLNTPNS